MSDAAANKARIQSILTAYSRGDMVPMMAALDDKIVWHSHSHRDHYPFASTWHGPAGVMQALSAVGANYDLKRYVSKEFVAEGDIVWVWNDTAFVHRPTGKLIELPLINRWRFKNGKIVEFNEFFDTAVVMQLEGRLNNANAPR